MDMKNLLPVLFVIAIMSSGFCDSSQQTAPAAATPCKSGPEFRQLDFWIGDWNVTANGKPAGKSHVELILADCVIFENWTGVSGYSGKSFNLYDTTTRQWQQHWVDSSGSAIDFVGKYENGAMRYRSVTVQADGSKVLGRMSFTKLENGSIRQLWEQSSDDGKTWTVAFDGIYTRAR